MNRSTFLPSLSERRREVLCALLPAAAVLLVFSNTLPGDFIFDDSVLIRWDPRLQAFDLHRIFRENYWGAIRRSPNYRPLTLLSYAINFRISERPWAFHGVNVLLGAAAALTFYLVAREVLRVRWVAAGAGTVFAVLPIHTEAVANVVGRAELLAAIAAFTAWWLALRSSGRERPLTALLIAWVVLLGMLCKENTAVVAGLIPLSSYLLRRKVALRYTAAALAGVLLYTALAHFLLVGSSLGPEGATLLDNPLAREPWPVRALNAVVLLGLYAFRTVFPLHLSADHSYRELPVLSLSSPWLWLAASGVVLGLLLPVLYCSSRRPVLALGVAVFPVAFAATSNVFFPIGTIFAERLAFLPSAGYALALGGALAGLGASKPGRRRAAILGLSVLTAAYGARSVVRNSVWAEVASFNIRLAKDSPRSSRAHTKAAEGYALLARRAGPPEEKTQFLSMAEAEIAEALRIYPENAGARAVRAVILMDAGRLEEALGALQDAEAVYSREQVQRDPRVDMVRGEVLFKLGRPEEACRSFDAYLESWGPAPMALNLRGVCRMEIGRLDGARQDLEAAVALDPRNATARMNRGILLAKLGRLEESGRDFDAAVRLAPDDPQAYNNRGFLRFKRGDVAGAVADYRVGLGICDRKGLLAAPAGESVLAFRKKIFDALLSSGDPAGARCELEALRAIPSPLAAGAARDLEARLTEKR